MLSDLMERLRALEPAHLLETVREMAPNEAIGFVIFLVFTIGFFLWVAYLVIRR